MEHLVFLRMVTPADLLQLSSRRLFAYADPRYGHLCTQSFFVFYDKSTCIQTKGTCYETLTLRIPGTDIRPKLGIATHIELRTSYRDADDFTRHLLETNLKYPVDPRWIQYQVSVIGIVHLVHTNWNGGECDPNRNSCILIKLLWW